MHACLSCTSPACMLKLHINSYRFYDGACKHAPQNIKKDQILDRFIVKFSSIVSLLAIDFSWGKNKTVVQLWCRYIGVEEEIFSTWNLMQNNYVHDHYFFCAFNAAIYGHPLLVPRVNNERWALRTLRRKQEFGRGLIKEKQR